jgi:putative ABC transport system permease protein
MFRSFLIISIRNLKRQKGFSIINLAGLTLGLTVGFIILLYVFTETSYDNFHPNSERLYRVAIKGNLGDKPLNVAVTPGALGVSLKSQLPEIETFAMFEHVSGDQLFSYQDKKFYENHLIYADRKFAEVFAIKYIYGDQSTSLINPYSLVLTESTAEKFFGEGNPVGEEVKLNNAQNYLITGVIEDLPTETHLPVNAIASFETRIRENGQRIMDDWGNMMYYTYIRLYEGIDLKAFESKLADHINAEMKDDFDGTNIKIFPYLQPVRDIHLKSNILGELKPNSDISYIYILTAIAIAILFIAGINFMNLSTARSANRAKEVSIRKINGSTRKDLIIQFLGESVFLSSLAFLFSIAIIELILPVFNNLTNQAIIFNYQQNLEILLFFFLISFLFGIFSGSYPAFFLSSFKPVKVLQSNLKSGMGNKGLRNILVFIQFAIASGLIVSTLIIYLQLNFIQKKQLGFEKDNLISIYLRNTEIQENAQFLKSEMLSIPGIESASLANSVPGMTLSGSSYFPEGKEFDPWLIYNFEVDQDFIENTFRMKILEGRNFSSEFVTDSNAVIINEKLVNILGWDDPINKKFYFSDNQIDSFSLNVIGVVGDFHFRSLHEEIEPTMLHLSRGSPEFLILRTQPGSFDYTIENIRKTWKNVNPELPFDFEFIDESFSNLYSSEKKLSLLFTYLTIFAIFIASLGLLGLVSYTAEQRTKEIGVRKVMGASTVQITSMLSYEYIRLIVFSNILSMPLSYILMNIWLNNFSYQTSTPWWIYLTACIITLITALLVINIQTIKISSDNPINSLRYE